MNLVEFLEFVDNYSNGQSDKRLKQIIHSIAKKVPIEQREQFIELINNENKIDKNLLTPDLLEKIEKIKEDLEFVNSNKVYIIKELDPTMSDWENEEYYYRDNFGIWEIIKNAESLINILFDIAAYKECLDLAEYLFETKIQISSDWDDEIFDLEDMVFNFPFHFDLKNLKLKAAYSSFKSLTENKRIKRIINIANTFPYYKITFEDLFQMDSNPEIPEDFLVESIEYLSKLESETDSVLLEEALDLYGDNKFKLDLALSKVNEQPELIYKVLKQNFLTKEEKLKIGFKILDKMDKNYVIRSKIALLIANIILETNQDLNKLDFCYRECFRSNTTPTNLLRFLLNSTEPKEKLITIAKEIIDKVKNNEETYYRSNQSKIKIRNNCINNRILEELDFLCGDFLEVFEKSIINVPSLGWSFEFTKTAIPLYCFLISKHNNLPKLFTDYFVDEVEKSFRFSSSSYLNGLNQKDDYDLFFTVLKQWKSLFTVSKEFKEKVLKSLDVLIINRVHAIMKNNRRNYYDECVYFIVLIAQTHKSVYPNFKVDDYIQKFIEMYPRRRNFVRELRLFLNNEF